MRKGSVVLVPFPFTDLSGQKVRPAVVLHAAGKGEDFVAAFVSSVPAKRVSAFEVAIGPSAENGLKVPSRIRVDKIATLEKRIAVGTIGTVESGTMGQIDGKLRKLFGL